MSWITKDHRHWITRFFLFLALIISTSLILVWWAYQIKLEGTLYLDQAWGVSTITREPDTLIAHIRGESKNSAIYGLGFSHA